MTASGRDSNKKNYALIIAFIGLLGTAIGYVATYIKDVRVQELKQKHSFIIQLLRDDPRISSRNLLWAHGAELITLTPKTIDALTQRASAAPSVSESYGDLETSREIEYLQDENIPSLVRSLDSETKSNRWKSLEQLELRFSNNPDAVNAVLEQLSGDTLEALSVNGRYNNLYYLNEVAWEQIDAGIKSNATAVINNIEERHNEGVSTVGDKTQGLIDSIKSRLE